MKNRNARIKFILCGLVVLVAILSLFLFIRFRGAVKVFSDKDIIVTENIIYYRQDDNAWAEDKLGNSNYTIESSGCLISCIASGISMSGEKITPGEFNICYKDAIFDSEGNLLWNNLKEHSNYEVNVYSDVSEEILTESLEKGIFPIVRVRVNGIGNFHYVLIVKAEDGMFYCMDPLKDGLIPLSKYGNRIYAIRSVYVN